MELLNIGFAFDCLRFVVLTALVASFSAIFVWILLLRGENEIGAVRRFIGTVAFIALITIQGLIVIIFRHWWPEIILTIWGLISVIAIWDLFLEPLCFKISQEFSRMTGFELSDYLAIVFLVPWRWIRESAGRKMGYRSLNPIAEAVAEEEYRQAG